jgi:hypothetical protein
MQQFSKPLLSEAGRDVSEERISKAYTFKETPLSVFPSGFYHETHAP